MPGQLRTALLKAEEAAIAAQDAWRIPYPRRLLAERPQRFYNGDVKEEERVRGLIDSLL